MSCGSIGLIYTSSERLLPTFVTVALIVTFCPAVMMVGVIFRSEYLKIVYDLQVYGKS